MAPEKQAQRVKFGGVGDVRDDHVSLEASAVATSADVVGVVVGVLAAVGVVVFLVRYTKHRPPKDEAEPTFSSIELQRADEGAAAKERARDW